MMGAETPASEKACPTCGRRRRGPVTLNDMLEESRVSYVPPERPPQPPEVLEAEAGEEEAREAVREAHDALGRVYHALRIEASKKSTYRPDGTLVVKPTRRLTRLRRDVEDARREYDRRGEELRRARIAANRARRRASGRGRRPADAERVWPGSPFFHSVPAEE